MLNDIIPIVPVLIVALAACAVLLAEAFRREDDWMPVGLARAHRPGRRPSSRRSGCGTSNAVGFGVIVVDNFALFFNVTALRRSGCSRSCISSGTAERDQLPTGEYYALMLFSIVRHDADGLDARPARHLHRARDHVARRLRA